MKSSKIDKMYKGWFIGNFLPTLYSTNDVEVALKTYVAGDYEKKHFHKISTEFTVVVSGEVKMFEQNWVEGDIIIASPGDATDFTAVTDAKCMVVKIPGALNDKYESEE